MTREEFPTPVRGNPATLAEKTAMLSREIGGNSVVRLSVVASVGLVLLGGVVWLTNLDKRLTVLENKSESQSKTLDEIKIMVRDTQLKVADIAERGSVITDQRLKAIERELSRLNGRQDLHSLAPVSAPLTVLMSPLPISESARPGEGGRGLGAGGLGAVLLSPALPSGRRLPLLLYW